MTQNYYHKHNDDGSDNNDKLNEKIKDKNPPNEHQERFFVC